MTEGTIAIRETEQKAVSMLERAQALTIRDNADYLAVDQFCVDLKGLEKQIVDHHKAIKEAAWQAHKTAVATEAKALVPVVEARKIAKGKLSAWEDEQDRLRQEEGERLRKIEEKRAADERKKEIEKAKKAGDKATAKELKAAPLNVAPVVLQDTTPKAQTVTQKRWAYRVVDPMKVPREYLMLDEIKIGGVVRSTKGTVKIPGIEAYERAC